MEESLHKKLGDLIEPYLSVNLRSELEIATLHEKMDLLMKELKIIRELTKK